MKTVKAVVAMVGLALSGCISISDLSASTVSVAPDGRQTFRIAIPDGQKQAHSDLIGKELAWRKFCMSGYEITATSSVESATVYEGVCKKE